MRCLFRLFPTENNFNYACEVTYKVVNTTDTLLWGKTDGFILTMHFNDILDDEEKICFLFVMAKQKEVVLQYWPATSNHK